MHVNDVALGSDRRYTTLFDTIQMQWSPRLRKSKTYAVPPTSATSFMPSSTTSPFLVMPSRCNLAARAGLSGKLQRAERSPYGWSIRNAVWGRPVATGAFPPKVFVPLQIVMCPEYFALKHTMKAIILPPKTVFLQTLKPGYGPGLRCT